MAQLFSFKPETIRAAAGKGQYFLYSFPKNIAVGWKICYD
jgi:hypothetical protein